MKFLKKMLGKSPSPAEFWAWFGANSDRIRSGIDTQDSALIEEIGDKLSEVDPELAWEMGALDDEISEFVISADGVRDNIPSVEAMMAVAPSLPGWKLTAYRQAKEGIALLLGDQRFDVDSIFFRVDEHGEEGEVDLTIFIEGYTEETSSPYLEAAFLLLDATVGEYNVMTRLRHLDFEPLAAGEGNLQPLSALPSVLQGS